MLLPDHRKSSSNSSNNKKEKNKKNPRTRKGEKDHEQRAIVQGPEMISMFDYGQ